MYVHITNTAFELSLVDPIGPHWDLVGSGGAASSGAQAAAPSQAAGPSEAAAGSSSSSSSASGSSSSSILLLPSAGPAVTQDPNVINVNKKIYTCFCINEFLY